MNRLPNCPQCQFYAASAFLVCALFPAGPMGDRCGSYLPRKQAAEEWTPVGYRFVEGDLVPDSDWVNLPDEHPSVTSRCPRCRELMVFEVEPVHWDCPDTDCGWMDDSI